MGCCAVCKQGEFPKSVSGLEGNRCQQFLYQSGFVLNGTEPDTRLEAEYVIVSETRKWDQVFEGREMNLWDGEEGGQSLCVCLSRGGRGMVCFSNTLILVSVKRQLLPRRIILVLASAYYAKGANHDLRIDSCGFGVGVVDCLQMALGKCKVVVINGRDLFFAAAHYASCKQRSVSWEP